MSEAVENASMPSLPMGKRARAKAAESEDVDLGLTPIVQVIPNLVKMRNVCIKALAAQGEVYKRNGELVDVPDGCVRRLPYEELRAKLSACVDFQTGGDRKEVPVPDGLVGAIMSAGVWPGIAELSHMQTWPVLRKDGSLCTKAGYDKETHTYYAPPPGIEYKVAESPSRADAVAASARLLRFVEKNTFQDDHGPAAWLSFVLTVAGRSAFTTAPAFGVDAANQASGKSALIRVAVGIITGEVPTGTAFIENREEQEKRVLEAWTSERCTLFDNLEVPFGGDVFDAVLTTGSWKGRILGKTDSRKIDCSRVIFAYTGNQLSTAGDMASRTVVFRIGPPKSAGKFLIADENDLDLYTPHRAQAASDALTILRAYKCHLAAGGAAPELPDRPVSGPCRFKGWSECVRAAVVWLGMPDPFTAAEGTDSKGAAEQDALARLHAMFGVRPIKGGSIATSWERQDKENAAAHTARLDLLKALQLVYGKRISGPIAVGFALGKLRDKKHGSLAFKKDGTDNGSNTYAFMSAK